ncbi:hypothetical protein DPMN_005329 [Dreissena polymorpha]|uniref:Uncharacterized protein n=1 Tax=Dreissena polymorpha TaxID=45954 RepID=A0A9D4MQ19_DREPO|nr:hypothetical protein DPMN_005329 [Dreissena polymorpha]
MLLSPNIAGSIRSICQRFRTAHSCPHAPEKAPTDIAVPTTNATEVSGCDDVAVLNSVCGGCEVSC